MRITEVVHREMTCMGQQPSDLLVFLDQDRHEFDPTEEDVAEYEEYLEEQLFRTQTAMEQREKSAQHAEAFFKDIA